MFETGKSLDKESLLKYIKQAIDLESSIVAQNKVSSDYDETSEQRKPKLKERKLTQYPATEPKWSETMQGSFIFFIGCFLLFLICFFCDDDGSMAGGTFFFGFCSLVCLLIFIPAALKYKESKAKYNSNYEAITERNKTIRQENEAEKVRYQNNLNEWNVSNRSMHQYFAKPLQETQDTLEKLYSADVIYPKYRNLPALTSIYEYLITGRCEELSGPHGAYNLYEDEVRKDTVISQLNAVIANLERIRQNQYMLYEQIQAIQNNTRAIATELHGIYGYTAVLAELTALNAFYAGVEATNSAALSYCALLDTHS